MCKVVKQPSTWQQTENVRCDFIYFHFINNVIDHSKGISLAQIILLISGEVKIW